MGVSGAAWCCSRESAAQSSPTSPHTHPTLPSDPTTHSPGPSSGTRWAVPSSRLAPTPATKTASNQTNPEQRRKFGRFHSHNPSPETTPAKHATWNDREHDAAELIGGGTKTATTPPEPTKDLSKSANIIERHFFTARSLVQDARYAGFQGSGHELPARSDPGANQWDGLMHSVRQLQVRWSGSRCSTRTPACS